MKYVVLGRDKKDDYICRSFGVFSNLSNARIRLAEICDGNSSIRYLIEEVDPFGSFANDEVEDI